MISQPVAIIDPERTRDITPDALESPGRPKILPASYWETTTVAERALFGHRHGIYLFPTTELVEHLTALIAGRKAIEIGAGNGALADALGIPATDNRTQEKPRDGWLLALARHPPVTYGPDVIECHASRAVRRFKPQVVVAAWVSEKYDPARPHAGGPFDGVDERDVLLHCETYILVGNTDVHRHKSIWARPHTIEYPPFVYSRASSGSPDFVAVWNRAARR